MSFELSFADERVMRMPPMSVASLEALGSELAAALGLRFAPGRAFVDWSELLHVTLPRLNVHVYPARSGEIEGAEGATDPTGAPGDAIYILLPVDVNDAVELEGRAGNRARSTFLHEVSHAALHVPLIRQWARRQSGRGAHDHQKLLNRVRRGSLRAYEDPEWQAWTLAGCIIAPRSALEPVAARGPERLAPGFGVSGEFLQAHMRRLKLIGEGR